jgi:hypothetical protein
MKADQMGKACVRPTHDADEKRTELWLENPKVREY